ncbi:hypothetical protein H0E87_028758, partial [Populus deltoides]
MATSQNRATEPDVYCLKSIKDSLEDPYNHFSSWDFADQTEGFISTFTVTSATETDLSCLKSIKDSMIDPNAYLNTTWNFNNNTEGFIFRFMGVDCWHPGENRVLNGPIPSDICKRLPQLTNLDLSFNSFSGEIPSSIADCHYLNDLKLDNNDLAGHIPPQIGQLDRMKVFTVTSNRLSGPVPVFTHNDIPADSFANNTGLCGKPLKSCSSHQMKRKHKITDDDQAGSSPTRGLLEEGIKEISMLEKRVTRMSYADLNDATDNFSENNVIGQGMMGMLYKASLPNGYVVAVKKLHDSQFLEEQFISELKIHGSLRHINVLPLLGFCVESNQRFLVYKYMPNGNLYDWLHSMEEGQEKAMEWGVRVKVAVGLARGLAWLHQNCHTVKIIHLDISSKCILLDQNFQPKLSNFGEAMLMSSTCASSVNSEFWEMAFVKEDVHGFGVVLLEMITGVDPSNMTGSSNNVLNEWIGHLLSSSNFHGAIDKSLIGQGFDAEIVQLLKVACTCVDPIPDRRPIMLQVYEDIKAIRERCDLVDDSSMLTQPEICPATSEKS